MVYSLSPSCHPALSAQHLIDQNCLRIFLYQKTLEAEVFSFCQAHGMKDCEGFQCPPSGAGTSQTPATLCRSLGCSCWTRCLTEPDRGKVSKTVCFHCLQKIAALAGCEKSSSAAMIECLRGKTQEELVQITEKMVGEMMLLAFK